MGTSFVPLVMRGVCGADALETTDTLGTTDTKKFSVRRTLVQYHFDKR